MIDHESIYCDVFINGDSFNGCAIKYIHIISALDKPFKLKARMTSSDDVAFFQKQLFQPFSINISSQDNDENFFSGVLTRVSLMGKDYRGDYIYDIMIQPAISLYRDEAYQYLFNGLSVIDIAKQILNGRAFDLAPPMSQDYDIKLMGDRDYPMLYRILMQDETLLGFFQRILSYQGLSYFFDHATAKSPLVISDHINHFATNIEASYTHNAPDALTLKPYIESIIVQDITLPQSVLSSGSPALEPKTLFAEKIPVLKENKIHTLYHVNTNEQSDSNAKIRAEIASLALQSRQHKASMTGGGLLLAGMRLNIKNANAQQAHANAWLIRESIIEIAFDEHDCYRIGSIATKIIAQDASVRYQAMPDFGEHATLMTGVNLGTPGKDIGSNLLSVNEQGHYHAKLPNNIGSNAESKGAQVFDTRMMQPMHSNDHSSHMTLPTNGEGAMLWSEGFSGEPLMIGTVNNINNTHATTEANPQNAYWQDNDTNKMGFISEGTFIPYSQTGRKAASILESPSYDASNNKSYVRMGDAINNDSQHPAQAAEPGLFLHTSGNYHEQHQGGLLTLAGNLYQEDSSSFTPTMRHMVTLEPILGSYEVIDSVTAHLHSDSLTSDNVSENHEQDETTINKTLSAQTNKKNYHADTTDNIYVNQQHKAAGDATDSNHNQYHFNASSKTTTFVASGDQFIEAHDAHNLDLNHADNQWVTQTQADNIQAKTTEVSTHSQDFTNYSGQINHASINSTNLNITANNPSVGGNIFQQGGSLSILSGGGAPNIAKFAEMNQKYMNDWHDEQALQKMENEV